MTKTDIFSNAAAAAEDDSPPFVSVQPADEPEDLWLLEPVAATLPSADQDRSAASLSSTSVPTLMTEEEEQQEAQRKIRNGAGVASGIMGLLLGGPLFALILGFGAAYATEQEGALGDSARAVGQVALVAKAHAKAIDRKHRVVPRSQAAAQQAWNKAQQADREHHILRRAAAWARQSFRTVWGVVQEHRLLERSVAGVGHAIYWIADKVAEKVGGVPPGPEVSPGGRPSAAAPAS